jgi:hypothetical protein
MTNISISGVTASVSAAATVGTPVGTGAVAGPTSPSSVLAKPGSVAVGAGPGPYTTNLCVNGSFEHDLSGWTPVAGAALVKTSQDSVTGQYAMQVNTPGLAVGEGVYGPQAYVTNNCTGSVQAAFSGESGTLTISAVTNPEGVIVEQTVLHLTPAWQTVTLNGLALLATAELYILVQTSGSAQDLSFLMDAVQYEPESPAHPYIDGSLPPAVWLGTPFESASVLQGQFCISLLGGVQVQGSIELIQPGETFSINPPAGNVTSGGSISVAAVSPQAAFDDFALFALTDPDPAMTYSGWNTASLLSGKTNYTRPWGIFYPPVDYPASDGTLMWPRAAFMGMGLEYTAVAPGVAQNLTACQVEMIPLAGTLGMDYTPSPAVFDSPRALHLIVKPARLNYSVNPNFAAGLTGWSAFGSAVITQDGTQQYGVFGGWDGVAYTGGAFSMHVSAVSQSSGVSITVPDLIAGDTYTASVYVLPSASMVDLRLLIGNESGGVTGADGVTPLLTLFPGSYPVAGWVRAQVTFTASASTVALAIAPILTAAGTYPVAFNLAANLIEAGEVAGVYFDGSLGNPDYMWEGTPGLSRSYFYPNYAAGQQVVNEVLASHTPMSISAATAVYLTPPTQ